MKSFRPDEPNQQHPFVAPEGYFNDLPTRVQQQVGSSTTSHDTAPTLSLRWVSLTAGFVAVVAVAAWLLLRTTTPTTNLIVASSAEQLLAEVPTETLMDYLLLAEVDVMSATPLSEEEQEEFMDQFDANELLSDDPSDENN